MTLVLEAVINDKKKWLLVGRCMHLILINWKTAFYINKRITINTQLTIDSIVLLLWVGTYADLLCIRVKISILEC